VLLVASLTGNLLTFGERLVLANLVGDGNANFLWHGDTALLGLLVASLVGNLPCVGLLHILALIIGNTLAGAVNGSPHLVVALTLPLVLAILLVLRRAFSFCIRLVDRVVLLDTDILVDGVALFLVLGVALLSGRWLAESLQLVLHSFSYSVTQTSFSLSWYSVSHTVT